MMEKTKPPASSEKHALSERRKVRYDNRTKSANHESNYSKLHFSTTGRLPKHDLVFGSPINDPVAGFPLGDGDTGSQVWFEADAIHLHINKTDLWDDSTQESDLFCSGVTEDLPTLRHGVELDKLERLFYNDVTDCDAYRDVSDYYSGSLEKNEAYGFHHFDMETLPIIAHGVCESLLQSYDGVLRICPAIRKEDAVQFCLYGEGGFRVRCSASPESRPFFILPPASLAQATAAAA